MDDDVYQVFAKGGPKESHARTWLRKDTVGYWRFERMYRTLDPLLAGYPDATWVTVGDGRFGGDAHYVASKGRKVVATDISDVLLGEGKANGYIPEFRKENVERLSFADGEFDFCLCKESYHHFPRPALGLYEMLRVARKGVVLIEPNDVWMVGDPRRAIVRFLWGFVKRLLRRPRVEHDFEPAGNYVYTFSRRETEKVAMGLGLRHVAFKGLNDHYVVGVETEPLTADGPLFHEVRRRIARRDRLCRLGLVDYQIMTFMIFKEAPTDAVRLELARAGFTVKELPRNPYRSP